MNADMFEPPIRSGKIRKNAHWHQYRNGTINIMGEKFCMYSIKEAVKIWRKNNPI